MVLEENFDWSLDVTEYTYNNFGGSVSADQES
jgi:hypothetical protein